MDNAQAPIHAVILAAGRGQRLLQRDLNGLKPLTPVLGISLLERAIVACREVGVTTCYIVVGYEKERLIPYVGELADRYGMALQAVENPHWPEGNGTSALAVAPYMDSPFLLLMCDHVFDPAILRRLMAAGRQVDTCLLAVDYRPEQVFDLDDATKVRLKGDVITAIGKDVTPFDAIDTGLFLCRPLLFEALSAARAAGDGSLSGGLRRLAARRQFLAMDIGTCFWSDVDTPASLLFTEKLLLAADRARPLAPGQGPAVGSSASLAACP